MKRFRHYSLVLLGLLLGLMLAPQVGHTAAAAKKKAMATTKPVLEGAEIRGVSRGIKSRIKLEGKNLEKLTGIKVYGGTATASLLDEPKTGKTWAWAEINVPADAKLVPFEISVTNTNGESGRLKLFTDSLLQSGESTNEVTKLGLLPVGVWGELSPLGDTDTYEFNVRSGQKMVFELSIKEVGSGMPSPCLHLLDTQGNLLATATPLAPDEAPYLIHTFVRSGTYRIKVSDSTLSTAKNQFYRLSIGELPFVTSIFPTTVALGKTSTIQLTGVNLGEHASVPVEAKAMGETALPLPEGFRGRIPLKVLAEDWPQTTEVEPNNSPGEAQTVSVPAAINGVLYATKKNETADADLYRFQAKAGEELIIETLAVSRGSLADTKVEVLYPDGRKVEHLLLQAVRDSYNKSIRTVDPNTLEIRTEHWEEMALNQYLYMAGEIGKLYRWPFGPDSGFQMYYRGNKRVAYFDTTPASHALYEPFYIVEPHPPGTKLLANGLPTFTLYYENDDDAMRDLGSDSRLHFKAPKDGTYLVRVTDSRSFSDPLNTYRLLIRPARPDFKVKVLGLNPSVPPGNGRGFTVELERIDGFQGEVSVNVSNLPPGFFASTPIVVQAGHFLAEATLCAETNAEAPKPAMAASNKITATAMINGRQVTHEAGNLGKISLAKVPDFTLQFMPTNTTTVTLGSQTIPEIVIAPGGSVGALLRVARNGNTNIVNMDIDNLPHGVIVDNIGLNGVQVRAGETEREIFLSAFKWVPETDRLCQVVVKSARATSGSQGLQTSFPVMIKVRHKPAPTTASAR